MTSVIAASSPSSSWKKTFLTHLGSASAEFALATVTKDGAPRVRYCVHRGFWASIPENPYNKLAKNPAIYDSDCPVFTTDARSNKVADILPSTDRNRSGGGGLVEAVYYFKQVMIQWRIRGRCWILSPNDFGGNSHSDNKYAATVKTEILPFMRPTPTGAGAGPGTGTDPNNWNWHLEIENHFENLHPGMRGSFKIVAPGQPITSEEQQFQSATGGHLSDEPLAQENFRVAIITPDQVELVDLSNINHRRRFVWTRSPTETHWTMVETTA